MVHKSGTSEATLARAALRGSAPGSPRQPVQKNVSAADWGPMFQSWVVLRVKPQTEFETQRALEDEGFSALVPYERKYRRYGRRRRRVEFEYPLFPRYAFAGVHDTDDWRDLLVIETVSGVLGEPERPYQLSAPELDWLCRLSAGVASIDGMNLHHALRAGQWAQIAEGPMAGLAGYIDAIRGSRASVLMEMLGVWRAVEMPLDVLEVA